MSYEKQNFVKDQVLEAEHLNYMEDGIVANETELRNKQPKGNYVTKEEADETYQSKGNYLTEVPSEYATKSFVTKKIAEASPGDKNAISQMLINILRSGIYSTDQSKNIDFLEALFRSAMDEPSTPDDPSEKPDIEQNGSVLFVKSGVTVTQNDRTLLIT